VKTGYQQFLDDLSKKSLTVLKKNATDIEGYIRRRIEKALGVAKAEGSVVRSESKPAASFN